jgi:hypothetical protein
MDFSEGESGSFGGFVLILFRANDGNPRVAISIASSENCHFSSLAPRSSLHGHGGNNPTKPQAPRMLDEPPALSAHSTLFKRMRIQSRRWQRDKPVVGGEARCRGRASANFRREVWLQSLIRSTNTAPQLINKSQAPKEG